MSAYENYTSYPSLWNTSFPSHWEILPLYAIAREKSICNCTDLQLLSVYLDVGVIPFAKKTEKRTNATSKDLSKYQRVDYGDFVLNNQQAWRGSVGVSFHMGIVSPAYIVLAMNERLDSRFANYILRSSIMVDQYLINSKSVGSIQRNIYWSALKRIYVPVPPREEQDQIVRFLDWKVSEINRLINIKKKRLSVVQELISKQFRSVSSKSAGKAKLKYIVDICNDFIDINPADYYMKTGMYNRGRGIFRRDAILGEDMGDSLFQRIQSSCVMISGQFAWEAATYITTEEDEIGVASHRYYLLKSKGNIPPEYIWAFLISDYGQMLMKSCSHGAAGRNRPLNIKELLNEFIPIPDSEFETEMFSLVNTVQKMMKLRKVTLKEEQTLIELRSRLISDVVTGKIDVRGIEIPEYEYISKEMDEMMEDKIDDTEEEFDEE